MTPSLGWVDNHLYPMTNYTNVLQKMLQIFPSTQILVVNGDNLIKFVKIFHPTQNKLYFPRNPLEEVKKLEEFLILPKYFTDQHFYFRENENGSKERFPCFRNGSREICMKGDKGRDHPELKPETELYLKNLFGPMRQQFYEMTGIMLELSA